MEQFNLTDEQASKLERAAAGEVVDLTDDEAEVLGRVMAGDQQASAAPVQASPPPANVPPGGALTQGDMTEFNQVTRENAARDRQVYNQNPIASGVRAFGTGLVPGYTQATMASDPDPDLVRRQHEYATLQHPNIHAAGGIVQSLPFAKGASVAAEGAAKAATLRGASPVIEAAKAAAPSMGAAGATQFLTSQGNLNPDQTIVDLAPGAVAAGAGEAMAGPIFGEVIQGGMNFLNKLARSVGPQAAESVNNWLDRYIRQSALDPKRLEQLERPGTSQKGYQNAYEDMKEEVYNYFLPEGGLKNLTTPEQTIRLNAQNRLQVVKQGLDEARAATRIDVPDTELMDELSGIADRLIAQGGVGADDAAQIIKQEATKLLANRINRAQSIIIDPATGQPLATPNPNIPRWETKSNLQDLEVMKTGIESPAYEPGIKMGDPSAATTKAADALDEGKHFIAAKRTGNDPFQTMAEDEAASKQFATTQQSTEAMYGVEGTTQQPGGTGLASNATAAAKRGIYDSMKGRIARTGVGTAQSALKWAQKRLANQAANVSMPITSASEAPFQIEAFKKQVEALASMDPHDFAVGLYAISATDPVFSAMWRKSQEEDQ